MEPSARSHSKKRILVVEDDDDSAGVLKQFFSPQYEVILARDGLDGLEQAEKWHPDLIISDVAMPRLDGLSMVRHLRASSASCGPVIFLSARSAPSDVIAGITSGARHYLTKPVDLNDLKRKVARALDISA